jgi:hypothetical protein
MEKFMRQQLSRGIDWKSVFDMFDHRRWATFAVVHGLLRRVHNYPLVLDLYGSNTNYDSTGYDFHIHNRNLRGRNGADVPPVREIAAMMDGTHSDDELVTEFNLPIERLYQLVKSNSEQFLFSVYSTAPSGN